LLLFSPMFARRQPTMAIPSAARSPGATGKLQWRGVLALSLCHVIALSACGPSQQDAELAIAEIEEGAASIETDAKRFAPESYARYKSQLAALKAAFEKREFDTVVDGSAKLTAALDETRKAAETGKADFDARQARLEQRWDKLDTDLGSVQGALEKRLRMLADSPQLPQNFDRARLERVGTSFARHAASRREAQSLAKSGEFAEALLRGAQIEAGYLALMREVGLAPAQ